MELIKQVRIVCHRLKSWTWITRLKLLQYQWTHVDFDTHRKSKDWKPDYLTSLKWVGPVKGMSLGGRQKNHPVKIISALGMQHMLLIHLPPKAF